MSNKLLLHLCYQSRANFETLPNGACQKKDRTTLRSWSGIFPLPKGNSSKLAQEMQRFRDTRVVSMEKATNPDIPYGGLAAMNRYRLLHPGNSVLDTEFKEYRAYIVKGMAVLGRGGWMFSNHLTPMLTTARIKLLRPKNDGYIIKQWSGSYLLPLWGPQERATIFGYGSNLTLKTGQSCIFHSNLIHCDGIAHSNKSNFRNVREKLKAIDERKINNIE